MKFFNLDQHISVISDLTKIFTELGHTVDSINMSGHSWVIGKEKQNVPFVENNIHQIIEKELWKEFYREYKEKLKDYDAFIVTYPPVFSLLYKEFDKPVLLHIPIRYDFPYTDNDDRLSEFNAYLRDDKVIPCANSLLDKAYFEDRVGKECRYIPSLCEYTGMKYSPKREDFLLYDGSRKIQIENTVNRYDLHPHTWADIQSFKGIIHIPYQVSTMSFFEQYSAGIPLFYPSKTFLEAMFKKNLALDQCFWTRTQHGKYGFETIRDVIELADYYNENFPNVILFNSKLDLEDKMYDDALLKHTNEQMIRDNKILHDKVYYDWEKVLSKIFDC